MTEHRNSAKQTIHITITLMFKNYQYYHILIKLNESFTIYNAFPRYGLITEAILRNRHEGARKEKHRLQLE